MSNEIETSSRAVDETRVLCVIPARMGSVRLPGKPLASIGGCPMIEWVFRAASASRRVHRTVVATDDEDLLRRVLDFGAEAVLTSPDHPSGSDRVAEVARRLEGYDLILNVQGDEPLMRPETLDVLVEGALSQPDVGLATLRRAATGIDEIQSPRTAKIVLDRRGRALYFSRSAIPHDRDAGGPGACWIQIGVYAYRREFLLLFPELPSGPLEGQEKLEQLRALENGFPVLTVETSHVSMGVDTEEDLEAIRALVAERRLTPCRR